MIPAEIIAAKRDGLELTSAQIEYFIQGYAKDLIPDYQMSAFAMAVYLNGMTGRETAWLTTQMLQSGATLKWPDDGVPRVDKHSTGGVGDKVSIPLAPLLAACGVQVPMLSGRGLGPTGGTLDKLESIPGFRTELSLQETQQVTQDVGCVITGASAELAPADRRLYALRDVTATVPSVPLITASIMSKKLAESPDALVLDVKFGSGAFMKTRERATELARSLVQTGLSHGVATTALLTDMNQPLGRMCGNAVEILESLDILRGEGPADVRELTIALAAEVLAEAGCDASREAAAARAEAILDSGAAFEKFREMVSRQNGQPDAGLEVAPASEIAAESDGIVSRIDTEQLGLAIIAMGGGRQKVSDAIDHSVGIEMLVSIGDPVQRGQPLVRVFCKDSESCRDRVLSSVSLSESAEPLPLIVDRIPGKNEAINLNGT